VSITYTDIFCGAGGSSIGLSGSGMELKLAANHWARAIETHSANYPDAEHLCADVNNYDMRRLPTTDVLWASPICTELSPAGGKRKTRGQLDLLAEGPIDSAGYERTRATFHDVIRATEVHRYRAVIVENVVDVLAWELFDWWLGGMKLLGYRCQFVSVSSAHVGGPTNPHAPQWRDRLYMVFTRESIREPDVTPRPLAWCFDCGENVQAVQSWRRQGVRMIGKYRQQYDYRCPNSECKHAIVEPYVLPAAAAIDWSNLGTRIGDRTKPLAANTMRRIQEGLRQFSQPVITNVGGNTWERPGSGYVRAWPTGEAPMMARTGTPADALACPPLVVNINHPDNRSFPAHDGPLPSRTIKLGEGMLVPSGGTWNNAPTWTDEPMRTRLANEKGYEGICVPFITEARRNSQAASVEDDALATVTAGGNHHELTIPPGAFHMKVNSGNCVPGQATDEVGRPFGSITRRDTTALVIPYRRGRAKTSDEPLHTLGTHDSAGLVRPEIEVDDCLFRMLQPREHLRAQRFPDSYIVTGNKGEQTMQAGNAVSANVAHWLGEQLLAVL